MATWLVPRFSLRNRRVFRFSQRNREIGTVWYSGDTCAASATVQISGTFDGEYSIVHDTLSAANQFVSSIYFEFHRRSCNLGVRGCSIICCIPYFRMENVIWNDDSLFVCNLSVSQFFFIERKCIKLS